MYTHVAFLRGINVGGHASVRMSDLQDAFARAGCRNVRTYIQSGNVLFHVPARERPAVLGAIPSKLRHLLDKPDVVFRTAREIEHLVERAPFKDVEHEPGVKLYVTFLARKPRVTPILPLVSSKEALEVIAIRERDVFIVSRPKPSGFFGFPNAFIEALDVLATTRNWTTVTKIAGLLREGALIGS